MFHKHLLKNGLRFVSTKKKPPLMVNLKTVFFCSAFSGMFMYMIGNSLAWTDPRMSNKSIIDIGSVNDPRHKYGSHSDFEKCIKEIAKKIGNEGVSTDLNLITSVASQENQSVGEFKYPKAIAFPNSTDDVSKIAETCHKYRIPLLPVSGGTSLELQLSADSGGIYISFERMDKVLKINYRDLDAIVQPGVNWVNLNEQLKEYNLLFSPDPGPNAQIGGMIGTRCSGTNAARYGTMRENTLSLTVVLADGTIVKTGMRPRKSSNGYDLTKLFIGAEGTLGIVTEICVKLHPLPEKIAVASCNFNTVSDAAQTAFDMILKGVKFRCIEIVDDNTIKMINKSNDTEFQWTEKPHLLLKIEGTPAEVDQTTSIIQKLVLQNNGNEFKSASGDQADSIWAIRKNCLTAFVGQNPGKKIAITDVAVPLSKLPDIFQFAKLRLDFLELPSMIVCHAGDGNIHTTTAFDSNDRDQVTKLNDFKKELNYMAIEMEGTVSGEHAIGQVKREELFHELGPKALGLMRKIKFALDPLNILNPGNILLDKVPEMKSNS